MHQCRVHTEHQGGKSGIVHAVPQHKAIKPLSGVHHSPRPGPISGVPWLLRLPHTCNSTAIAVSKLCAANQHSCLTQILRCDMQVPTYVPVLGPAVIIWEFTSTAAPQRRPAMRSGSTLLRFHQAGQSSHPPLVLLQFLLVRPGREQHPLHAAGAVLARLQGRHIHAINCQGCQVISIRHIQQPQGHHLLHLQQQLLGGCYLGITCATCATPTCTRMSCGVPLLALSRCLTGCLCGDDPFPYPTAAACATWSRQQCTTRFGCQLLVTP